ncbi:MAG: myxosortase family intramembrane protease [Myxococcota bacterium]
MPAAGAAAGAREALLAAAALLLLLAVGKPLAPLLPLGGDFVFTAVAAFQLYVPLRLMERHGELPESHRIHAHGLLLGPVAALRRRRVLFRRRSGSRGLASLDRLLASYGRGATLRWQPLRREVALVLGLVLLTFPPFAVGHHLWRHWLLAPGATLTFHLTLPPEYFSLVATNLLLVALPEELFYRGFVETRLERLWPTRRSLFGVPLGRTVFVASALFALGHWFGEWGNPARLGPFFPAFLFSLLARRQHSIVGAVTYHGLSNIFSATLLAGYRAG